MIRTTRIKQLLAAKNMTQVDLAQKTGVNRVEIAMVANRKKIAYPLERRLIARTLGKPESQLFDDEGFALLEGGGAEDAGKQNKGRV